ncbi:MAG: HepT-like ribonuclease domain-containing protein [Syntrophobacteraceae bacterium]
MDRSTRLLAFMDETIIYFLARSENVDRDRYFADRDIRNILDKTINDIILCLVDISEECLKKAKRIIPDTYRDTILACHELLGEIVIKVAPLVRHRNETIHQYLKVNWQNIVTVKSRIPSIREFVETARAVLTEEPN